MDEGIRARLGLPGADPAAKERHALRVFGLGLAMLLLLAAGLAWHRGRPAAPWELGLSAIAALLAALRPSALKAVYTPWMRVTEAIGKFNTFLVMSATYYLLITPYGMALRLLGNDLLDEKLRDRDSYWHPKGPPPDPGSYRNQF
jgi:hypothetical protein